jgi:hypothetical protein
LELRPLGRGYRGLLLLKDVLGPVKRGVSVARSFFFFYYLPREGTGNTLEGCYLLVFGKSLFSSVKKG